MVSPNVQKVFDQALTLSESERQQLRDLLDDRDARQTADGNHHLQQLLGEGILTHIPDGQKDIQRFNRWQPVSINGKPASQTIIEERR